MIAFLDLIDSKEDQNKFNELYEKYSSLVYWIAKQRIYKHELAEECVQETFLSIAKNIKKIGEVDEPRTRGYVSTLAFGFAINAYRKERRRVVLHLEDNELEQELYKLADESEFENFDSLDLSIAMDKVLDDEERTYIYLKYTYDYAVTEIARMYSTTDYFVKKKINLALAKLKEYLQPDE